MKEGLRLNLIGGHENKEPDTTQEGLENEIKFSGNNQNISLISHFAKSRTDSGGPNSRRPDLFMGLTIQKNFLYLVTFF